VAREMCSTALTRGAWMTFEVLFMRSRNICTHIPSLD
jgi:hypothetical protein